MTGSEICILFYYRIIQSLLSLNQSDPLMIFCHSVSAHVDVPIDYAFGRCCDPVALGRWTLGSMGFAATDRPGVYRGTSLFDGTETFMEMTVHIHLWLVDFLVGSIDVREPRVSVRLTPGPLWGFGKETSLFSMSTWRASWMDDGRWTRTCFTHETEALLFKAQTEAAWAEGSA